MTAAVADCFSALKSSPKKSRDSVFNKYGDLPILRSFNLSNEHTIIGPVSFVASVSFHSSDSRQCFPRVILPVSHQDLIMPKMERPPISSDFSQYSFLANQSM